ncbi:hypothetical protein BD769DRAFT_1498462 [Suillus cothurnatus]|nr:hypothetical protein BD769DRAFT_1498462 [Suillus cothurnatus]
MRDFAKFSRWSSHGRNGYKPPETTISISSNKFAFRLSAVHPAAISHTTPSTRKTHPRPSISPMDSFSNILAMLSASKVNDESNPTSSTPVDEESSSSSGGCYCVIA